MQYRLTKPEIDTRRPVEPVVAVTPDDDDYTEYLQGVFGIALLMFFAQAFGSVAIANYLGATISLKSVFYVLPYISILATADQIVSVTTWSSVFTVAIVSMRVMFGLLFRRSQPQTIDGRATGLLMAGFLLVLQYARHAFSTNPVIDTWVIAQTAAGVIAATVIYLGFRPGVPQSALAESRVRPTRIERSNPSTQATRKRKSQRP